MVWTRDVPDREIVALGWLTRLSYDGCLPGRSRAFRKVGEKPERCVKWIRCARRALHRPATQCLTNVGLCNLGLQNSNCCAIWPRSTRVPEWPRDNHAIAVPFGRTA
jgi:hypothetical protein